MKVNKLWKWDKDDRGFYITPLVGFSWGEPYGKTIWIGWLRFLVTFHFEDLEDDQALNDTIKSLQDNK